VIRQKLPFLIDLTIEERKRLAKMGDKSEAFVRKALEAVQSNPDALPRSFDAAEFARDGALWDAFSPIASQVAQLAEMVDDTLVALSADLYDEALTAYGMLKAAGSEGGLDEIKASLSLRFRRGRGAKSDGAEPAKR
jgi:hypothetical protein